MHSTCISRHTTEQTAEPGNCECFLNQFNKDLETGKLMLYNMEFVASLQRGTVHHCLLHWKIVTKSRTACRIVLSGSIQRRLLMIRCTPALSLQARQLCSCFSSTFWMVMAIQL